MRKPKKEYNDYSAEKYRAFMASRSPELKAIHAEIQKIDISYRRIKAQGPEKAKKMRARHHELAAKCMEMIGDELCVA